MPIPGEVITEIEAIRILTGARAVVIGKGGISGAEGSVTMLILGEGPQLDQAKQLIGSVKGEKPLRVELYCDICEEERCSYRGIRPA